MATVEDEVAIAADELAGASAAVSAASRNLDHCLVNEKALHERVGQGDTSLDPMEVVSSGAKVLIARGALAAAQAAHEIAATRDREARARALVPEYEHWDDQSRSDLEVARLRVRAALDRFVDLAITRDEVIATFKRRAYAIGPVEGATGRHAVYGPSIGRHTLQPTTTAELLAGMVAAVVDRLGPNPLHSIRAELLLVASAARPLVREEA